MPDKHPTILVNATDARLEQAVARNHRELFCANAHALRGEVIAKEDLVYTYEGASRQAMVAFPSLQEQDVVRRLDEMMLYYQRHPNRGIGCWSLDPLQPPSIGVRLLARGFQPGWRPCWQALDLASIRTGFDRPGGLKIVADNDSELHTAKRLPYAGKDGAVSPELMRRHPDLVQRFVARLDGVIVGQCCLFFTTGAEGVAGMYNVGVVPDARERGIGRALVITACEFAIRKGYGYAVLNGTGRRMYEQIGFRWIGDGYTWWLLNMDALAHPPDRPLVEFAEAIGLSNIPALDECWKRAGYPALDKPFANGLTAMQLALHCHQPDAAAWLSAHGATGNVR